jgi:menaquinol-cytochrome c reductase iron-sulfur subunit
MRFEGPQHVGHGEEEAVRPGAQVSMPLITRRRFLGYVSGVLGAVIAAVLGLPLVRFYVGNAFAPRRPRWMELGPAAELQTGQPRLFTVSYVDQDGWRETNARAEVYAVTQNGRDYEVFSNICTHLGCPVRWDETRREFVCPCHGGLFAADGKVLHGPPPHPLTRMTHRVENGILYVRVGEA